MVRILLFLMLSDKRSDISLSVTIIDALVHGSFRVIKLCFRGNGINTLFWINRRSEYSETCLKGTAGFKL